MKKNIFQLKSYSLTELSNLYNVSIRTMKKWMIPFEHEFGAKFGRYYTINQVRIIFERLGLPCEIEIYCLIN